MTPKDAATLISNSPSSLLISDLLLVLFNFLTIETICLAI